MLQSEIDEVSDAFADAWANYFGMPMYLVALDRTNTVVDDLYNESKNKVYDTANKKLFHGTLKESPAMDEMHQIGKSIKRQYEITFVTKELYDQGVYAIDQSSIVQYNDRQGVTHSLKIVDDYQKVQLVDNKIFTKLVVIPYA